ncbi:MAG TPA: EF-P lysine aminoacylase EpmA [Thermoanaerobaculia bacterium]|nr:EF-P lysine aminoacylase EpmA [Thermoanaerobaculia bacterium]
MAPLAGDADWRPTASRDALRLRADMLARTRAFFARRGVLEVETPLLSATTVTDLHLHSVPARLEGLGRTLWLQTSPEHAMKRLLAAGSGPIYQLARAFRDGEVGRRHNPEFTLLEWYRPGFDDHRLMDEVTALLAELLPARLRRLAEERWSYRALLHDRLGVDPLTGSNAQLRAAAGSGLPAGDLDRDDLLAFLLTHHVEPTLPADRLVFLHDFPPSQAALARLARDARGELVARRFEVYAGGVELANGFWELADADQQRRRFEHDLARRRERGLPEVAVDELLLAAIAAGLPDCAGVALGFDRLVMLAAGADRLDAVLAFPVDRA